MPSLMDDFLERTDFEKRCRQQGAAGVKWEWKLQELKKNLEICLEEFFRDKSVSVLIFLDAVDVAGEEHMMDIHKCFYGLRGHFEPQLSVCWSSRPYSLVRAQYDFSMDIARENSDDVLALIESKMKDVKRRAKKAKSKPIIDRTNLEQIIVPLIHLSKGVLQWTAWILPRVIRLIKDGETVEVIVAVMKDYPRELGEDYHEYLSSIGDADVDIALNVFSWACLQVQPLSIEELRLAVCLSSTPELKSMKAIKAQ
jgi:hypothetical protein